MTTAIELDRSDEQVPVLRLNRPERLNALTHEMLDQLQDALAELGSDERARCIVLTGAGRGFCAGVDIGQSAERSSSPEQRSPARRLRKQEHFAATIAAVRACRLPVVAAVNGPAAGAGMALALASDVRVGSSTARFLIGAPRLGLSAGECGISWLLPRLIGAARAAEIMLTNREISSDEAFTIGLVTEVTEPELVLAAAHRVAVAISANSPFGVELTKKAMIAALDLPFAAAVELENRTQLLALQTADSLEAHQAFLAKRPPRWRGV
jgi:enoyl-CoA hydratase